MNVKEVLIGRNVKIAWVDMVVIIKIDIIETTISNGTSVGAARLVRRQNTFTLC